MDIELLGGSRWMTGSLAKAKGHSDRHGGLSDRYEMGLRLKSVCWVTINLNFEPLEEVSPDNHKLLIGIYFTK